MAVKKRRASTVSSTPAENSPAVLLNNFLHLIVQPTTYCGPSGIAQKKHKSKQKMAFLCATGQIVDCNAPSITFVITYSYYLWDSLYQADTMSAIWWLMSNMLRKASNWCGAEIHQDSRIETYRSAAGSARLSPPTDAASQTLNSRTLNTLLNEVTGQAVGEAEKKLWKLLLAAAEAPLWGTSCCQLAEDGSEEVPFWLICTSVGVWTHSCLDISVFTRNEQTTRTLFFTTGLKANYEHVFWNVDCGVQALLVRLEEWVLSKQEKQELKKKQKTDDVTEFKAISLSFQRLIMSQSCRKPVVKQNRTYKLCFMLITCSWWPIC